MVNHLNLDTSNFFGKYSALIFEYAKQTVTFVAESARSSVGRAADS